MRLNFDDVDKTTSKYFADSDKENVPERVKKKLINTKTPKTLLQTVQTQNIKNNFKSPWTDKQNISLSSDDSCKAKKLNFDDEVDLSDLGVSLEDRIKKKLNNVETKPKKGNKKTYRSPVKSISSISSGEDDKRKSSESSDEWIAEPKTKTKNKTEGAIDKTWTFLESLSGNVPINKCDMSARIYRNNFKEYKVQLADKLFKLYNKEIFDLAIPENTPIEWNDRMRGTAGFCYCRKVTRGTGAVERSVRIALSSKVVDSADRLRDTLVHELCHAATWLVNHVSDGHGPYWKAWAYKAMKRFPELPPIKRCHEYVINTKYTYKCTGCGYSIGRHSKSLDIERKRCGYCYGKFEVLLNKTSKKGETKSVPVTPKRPPTAFALFVKENYAQYKSANLTHGEVMKLLGQKFGEIKTTAN